jgi:hypothetical protein
VVALVPHVATKVTHVRATSIVPGALPTVDLPFIDEHRIEVAAAPERTWEALRHTASRSFDGPPAALLARLLGTAERRPHGDPTEPGSTITGFRVSRADAPVELVLEGEHRFSRYALIFHLEALPGDRSRLRAETRAAFPGLRGRAYRALVIGTRGHVLVVKRLLRAVKARAEGPRTAR